MKITTRITLLAIAIVGVLFISLSVRGQSCNASEPEVKQMRSQFKDLDPATKVLIWQAHLKKQLETRSLTQVQRDVIAAATKLLTVDLYRTNTAAPEFKSTDLYKQSKAVQERIRAEFSLKDGAAIFERLDYGVWQQYTGGRLVSKLTKTSALFIEDCTCSTWWTFCEHNSCSTTCIPCKSCIHVINCGPFWGYQCDGMCGAAEEETE